MSNPENNILSAEFVNDVVDHMNSDHIDSMRDYVSAYTSVRGVESVRMIAVSVTGLELECYLKSGERETVRIDFVRPLNRPEQVRGALVALSKDARRIIKENTNSGLK